MVCKNSIKTCVLEKNPNSFIAGCNCHLSHLAAAKGADAFSSVTGFDIEDHEVDIYYYFSKSTKRKGVLLEFLGFVDLEWGEVILKSMFTSRNESDEEITTELLYNNANYLPFLEVFIGLTTKTKLNKLLNEGDISQYQWNICVEVCRAFKRDALKLRACI